jgi:hypothetical protein
LALAIVISMLSVHIPYNEIASSLRPHNDRMERKDEVVDKVRGANTMKQGIHHAAECAFSSNLHV